MNYIYDIDLNFADCENYYDFFEWDIKDKISYVDEILIFKINSNTMKVIMNYKIKVSSAFLKKIFNTTKCADGIIKYSCLVTDGFKVLAIKFDNSGIVSEISSLLLDEEEEIIEDSSDYEVINLELNKISKYDFKVLTRRERRIQKELLIELKNIYEKKCYDEIDYYYKEFFSEGIGVEKEYKVLFDEIKNNFNSKYEKIYNFIKMYEM